MEAKRSSWPFRKLKEDIVPCKREKLSTHFFLALSPHKKCGKCGENKCHAIVGPWTFVTCFMTSTPNLPRANTRAGYFSSTHAVCIPFFPISFAGLFLIATFIFLIFGNCSQLSFFELSSHTDVTGRASFFNNP